jgi:tRNA(Ile)-lysidine synthase
MPFHPGSPAEGRADAVLDAVASISRETCAVLAVSGGIDSMSLLDAVGESRAGGRGVVVASFDHGTGPHAREGVALAAREGARRGFQVRTDVAPPGLRGEAAWRQARWEFLRRVAASERGVVVTAHTRDDQLETVVMRLMRHSGARGLAGLYARSDVCRPLLAIGRTDVEAWATRRGLEFVTDPSNDSRAHLRNRIRLDLLPALRRVAPDFEGAMLELARRAATLRDDVERVASGIVSQAQSGAEAAVPTAAFEGLDEPPARLLGQGVAGLLRIVLDRRGIVRLSQFARDGRTGQRIQVSGGYEVLRTRSAWVFRPLAVTSAVIRGVIQETALGDEPVDFGPWHFQRLRRPGFRAAPNDPWLASLPRGKGLLVRAWQPGDRMVMDSNGTQRRVKRFFSDAGIAGPQRIGWPVVLAAGSIVWIPGIRRSPLASSLLDSSRAIYRCEPLPR